MRLCAPRLCALFALIAVLLVFPRDASAQKRPAPGAPPTGVTFSLTFTQKVSRLVTQVESGDVVLLKSGTSRSRSNWGAILRFNVRPSREAATGFATVIADDGKLFRGVTLQSNAVYIAKSTVTTYTADASKSGKVRKATYVLDETRILY